MDVTFKRSGTNTRLTAFVGRSFSDADKMVWHDLRDILDALKPLGFEYEDAKEAQPRPISEKIREFINSNDIYIGLLTRRFPLCEFPTSFLARIRHVLSASAPLQWSTSEWVVEEIGYAIGKDRPVVLLVEEGVVFPTADLDADTEWVSFNRDNLAASQTRLTQMISNLIATRVPPVEAIPAAAVEPIKLESESKPPEPTFSDQLRQLKEQVLAGSIDEADAVHERILAADELKPEDKTFFDAFLLRHRAIYGDVHALSRLKKRCADHPDDSVAVRELAGVFSSFKQYRDAAALLLSQLERLDDAERPAFVISAAEALRKDGRAKEALDLVVEHIRSERDEQRKIVLYREIANAAQALKENDIEAAHLEKMLQLNPSDNDARFRLAYIYSESERYELAAHHYSVLTSRVDWPVAINNLGVTYGDLDLKATEISEYVVVQDKHALSKANLANLYAKAGFLDQGEKAARDALDVANDEQAHNRARYALETIAETRRKESEIIQRITANTEVERSFMVEYADGYHAIAPSDLQATYNTPHGDLKIILRENKLHGEGKFTKTYSGGLLALAAGLGGNFGAKPSVRTFSLLLEGALHGLTAKFELKIIAPGEPTTLLGETTRTITGLLVIEKDAQRIRFLEREDKKRKLYTATRVLPDQ